MGDLSHIYRDPLFGIAMLVGIIAFVLLADFYRNLYRKKQRQKSLNALVKSYEHHGIFDGIAEFLKVSKEPIPTLVFLAKSYAKGGDNQQAIKIYLTLIEQFDKSREKIEILEELGALYVRAGFLQKGKDIYLEILKNNPRNLKTLSNLVELYGMLGDYQSAFDALECIEENMGELSKKQTDKLNLAREYFRMQMSFVIRNEEDRNQALIQILQKEPRLRKVILGFFKINAPRLFWEYFPHKDWENLIDLLWDIPASKIPLSVIKESPAIEVFQAKGYYPSTQCKNFSLESIRLFQRYSEQKATLGFLYVCPHCQSQFPFDDFRCSACGELGELKLITKPQRLQYEKNLSLL